MVSSFTQLRHSVRIRKTCDGGDVCLEKRNISRHPSKVASQMSANVFHGRDLHNNLSYSHGINRCSYENPVIALDP